MKLKKGALLVILLFILAIIVNSFGMVQAAIDSQGKTLNIKFLRKSGYGYQLANSQKNVWKIYEEQNDKGQTIYCLKGGPGFGSYEATIKQQVYKAHFDMKNPDSITSGAYRNALPTNESKYASLMWLLDNIYVPAIENASQDEKDRANENKNILLEAANNYASKQGLPTINGGYEFDYLTDDDIDAVQQLAIWYFTNEDSEYHISSNKNFEFYLNSVSENADSEMQPLSGRGSGVSDYFQNGWDRMHACGALFKYLVNTAEANSSYNYKATSQSQPVELEDTIITRATQGNRLILGPYKITQLRNDINYSLNVTVTSGASNNISDVILLKSDKTTTEQNIKNLIGQDFYISVPKDTDTTSLTLKVSGSYLTTTTTYWSVENPNPKTDQPVVIVEKQQVPFEDEKVYTYTPELEFDLALRKFITSINGKTTNIDGINITNTRTPSVSDEELQSLKNGGTQTANKVHSKDPLRVETGDKVVYTIRIYNEGEIAGYAKEVTDYLPDGLKFLPDSQINRTYGWTSEDGKTVKTTYLKDKLINEFDGTTLHYEDLLIECEVIATVGNQDKTLKNIAEITEDSDKDGKPVEDRDSTPNDVNRNNYGEESQQDDDDFENLILKGKYFDLALRKFISSVQTGEKVKSYNRAPNVKLQDLVNGKSTTATYEHSKEPVSVSNGDIVTYTIRVYNEGQVDGYATKITDHLPEQLEFLVNDDLNAKYGWTVSSDGRTVTTDITSPNTTNSANKNEIYEQRTSNEDKVLLKAFNGTTLDYIDVQIKCKVKDNIDLYEKITNIAEIVEYKNNEGLVDRDSTQNSLTNNNSKPEDNVVNDNLPSDENLPTYKDTEIERGDKYIPGQQDDDDFEKLVLKRFDLALRKFITAVEGTEITNRVPVYNRETNTYTHPKDPVEVANGNVVTYTLRVFNEGNTSGYATKIKDDLPDGLVFLPEHETNIEYRWKMYTAKGEETQNVEEAKYIETDYLSKEQEETEGENLLDAFTEEMTMPDYKDVKIAFKVTEPNTSDRIITNIAEITEDTDEDGNPIEDVDSEPNNDKEDEDDIDEEHIKVKYFDLSLKKWVSESIVTYNGKTTVNKTGHTGDENPEAPAKVEIKSNQLSKTTVKFRFVIKVTNEGEIAGYAKEIIDYIPAGLTFNQADNKLWREEDGKVLTDQLKDKLLQPGESATVEIVLTWKNSKDNLGQKVNWAEIYEDENEYNSPDIDSTPGNDKEGEDDIDEAPVILSIKTGETPTYIVLALSSVAMLSSGVILIKKFVL